MLFNGREHDSDPIIIFDLKEFNNVLGHLDVNGMALGGQYDKMNELIEYFFKELKKSKTKLVFVAKLIEFQLNYYHTPYQTYDSMAKHGDLRTWQDDILESSEVLRPNERMWYNLINICKNYGEIICSYSEHKRAIMAYAFEHRNDVLALITRNTEFFVYDLKFQYWNLTDIELNTLKIAKFCQQTLNAIHGLSYQELQLMMAIFKVENKGRRYNKFIDKVEYIKELKINPNGYELSRYFDEATRQKIEVKVAEIKDTGSFTGEWNDDIHTKFLTELVKENAEIERVVWFFKEKIHFAYALVNEKRSGPYDLIFIDVRRLDSQRFIDLVISVTLKLIGVAFKDVDPEKRPKTRTMQIKRDVDQPVELAEMDIIYPTSEYMTDIILGFLVQNGMFSFFQCHYRV